MVCEICTRYAGWTFGDCWENVTRLSTIVGFWNAKRKLTCMRQATGKADTYADKNIKYFFGDTKSTGEFPRS